MPSWRAWWLYNSIYKAWSKSSETDFFTRLWVHFGTPLFAGWCPWTPSLPRTRDGPSAPLSPLWASVEVSRAPMPCNSHRRTEGMALVCGNKHAAGSSVKWKFYGANHHGRWDVGLRVWPGDETSVFAVEVCWLPEAKESAPGAVKCQSHAHCFLWYVGHCSLWVLSTRPKCKPTVLSTGFESSETCCFSQEATETGGGGLGATSRKCTSTHSTFHPGIFGKSWHSCRSATTLLPWHGSVWLLVVPPIKKVLKGKRFEDTDTIKQNVTSTLNTIPKDSFKKCFQQWQDRWRQRVSSQEEYFEDY